MSALILNLITGHSEWYFCTEHLTNLLVTVLHIKSISIKNLESVFFIQFTYLFFSSFLFFSPQNSLIILASSLYSGLVAWKYLTQQCFYLNCLQFLFEYCLPVLTKNKDCPVFSLLFIPWMMMVGLIWCNRICFLYDGNITDQRLLC